ncbi:hypothetical protein [Rivularia sp. UHCC 0363]|nr:hypothetical protein [Rivularia sp. UHCC 0363]MEA5599211.1 hypothetical protein [Rivularia sp. UHCC 0363]
MFILYFAIALLALRDGDRAAKLVLNNIICAEENIEWVDCIIKTSPRFPY